MLNVLFDAETTMIELSLLVKSFTAAAFMLGCLTVEGKRPCKIWFATIAFFIKTIFHELTQFELCVWFNFGSLVVILIRLRVVRLRGGPFFGAHTCGPASLKPLIHETFLVDSAQSEHRFGASITAFFIEAHSFTFIRQRCKPKEVRKQTCPLNTA